MDKVEIGANTEILEDIAFLEALISERVADKDLDSSLPLIRIKRRLVEMARPMPFLGINITEEQWREAMTNREEHLRQEAILNDAPFRLFLFEGITQTEIVTLDHRELDRLIDLVQSNQEFFGDPPAGRNVFRVCREYLEAAIRTAESGAEVVADPDNVNRR